MTEKSFERRKINDSSPDVNNLALQFCPKPCARMGNADATADLYDDFSMRRQSNCDASEEILTAY